MKPKLTPTSADLKIIHKYYTDLFDVKKNKELKDLKNKYDKEVKKIESKYQNMVKSIPEKCNHITIELPDLFNLETNSLGKRKKWDSKSVETLISLYQKGYSTMDIAGELKRTGGSVNQKIQDLKESDRKDEIYRIKEKKKVKV